jgi:hypothetical protein
MKNFHLPLPDKVYDELKLEANRSGLPATTMATQAIQAWLATRKKSSRKQAIVAYAAEMAGTEFDLDPALERATLELRLESESQ